MFHFVKCFGRRTQELDLMGEPYDSRSKAHQEILARRAIPTGNLSGNKLGFQPNEYPSTVNMDGNERFCILRVSSEKAIFQNQKTNLSKVNPPAASPTDPSRSGWLCSDWQYRLLTKSGKSMSVECLRQQRGECFVPLMLLDFCTS
jgi:hypothetical protein